MKRSLGSAISALLALGSVCLLLTVFANAAPPGESMVSDSPPEEKGVNLALDGDWDFERHNRGLGGINLVVGSAFWSWDEPDSEGYIGRIFTVVETRRGVRGHFRVDYWEEYLGEVYETTYVVKADCLDVEEETRVAWIGGRVVWVTGEPPAAPEIGQRFVEYVEDNDGGNLLNPDMHGSYWGPHDSCYDRPDPWFLDPSERGKIIVR